MIDQMHEINRKLIGKIKAIGESKTDSQRYDNLKIHSLLVFELVDDMMKAAEDKDRVEYSMNKIGKYAHTDLKELYNQLKDMFEEY